MTSNRLDLPLDMKDRLADALARAESGFSGNDRAFFRRVWSTPLDIYRQRIANTNFGGFDVVVDAGCGMGQWTVALAEANRCVEAVDIDPARVKATLEMTHAYGCSNVRGFAASLESIPLDDSAVDAIFCYGVLMCTDVRATIQEFDRVLRPGGAVYICANGPGWHFMNLDRPQHGTKDYDPRRMARQALAQSLAYWAEGIAPNGGQMAVPSIVLRRILEAHRFGNVDIAAEGALGAVDSGLRFFPGEYEGYECVYELRADKAL